MMMLTNQIDAYTHIILNITIYYVKLLALLLIAITTHIPKQNPTVGNFSTLVLTSKQLPTKLLT